MVIWEVRIGFEFVGMGFGVILKSPKSSFGFVEFVKSPIFSFDFVSFAIDGFEWIDVSEFVLVGCGIGVGVGVGVALKSPKSPKWFSAGFSACCV